MLMGTIKKNNLFNRIVGKSRSFLRPFYDNGSSVTAQLENRPMTYEPFYSLKQMIHKNNPESTF